MLAVTLAIAGLSLASAVSAHPLGNFSINHYNGVSVETDRVVIDHVLDMAEIPTFSERDRIDLDGSGDVSEAEATGYAQTACQETANALELHSDGDRITLAVSTASASLLPGQGAQTLRLECGLEGALAATLDAGSHTGFEFGDPTYAERRGWREVVVTGLGTTITDSDAPTQTLSDRLTSYPGGLDSELHAQAAASWVATPSSGTLASAAAPGAASGTSAQSVTATARVPGGEIGGDLAALIQAPELTLPAALLALAIAVGLGAAHAVSPGHGKTIMAAYLVGSRGSMRMAAGLGLMVTVSHTLGVLILAVVSLWASTLFPIERLYPILGIISGAIVIVLGAWMMRNYWRSYQRRRRSRQDTHLHAHEHAAPHDHDHTASHAHEGHADHAASHAHAHAASAAHQRDPQPDEGPEADDGWHSHGLTRHSHVPEGDTLPGWRGLAALGLAGGLVPSVSALILLLASISVGRPEFGIVLTVAFGLGMAFVLMGIGAMFVLGRGWLERRPSRRIGVVGAWVPALAAVFVLIAGITMAAQGFMSIGPAA